MMDDRQFNPDEFVIWLHGYAAAKPDVLDDRTRAALQGVIAFMTGRKLRGIVERTYTDDWQAKQPAERIYTAPSTAPPPVSWGQCQTVSKT